MPLDAARELDVALRGSPFNRRIGHIIARAYNVSNATEDGINFTRQFEPVLRGVGRGPPMASPAGCQPVPSAVDLKPLLAEGDTRDIYPSCTMYVNLRRFPEPEPHIHSNLPG